MLASAPTLVLAFLALTAGRASGKFSGYDFTCDDGSSLPSGKLDFLVLCDGVDDCADGSDEAETLCDANVVENMTVGDKLVARVQFDFIHHYIKFSLCNSSNCSRVQLYDVSPGKALTYYGGEGCNRHGGFCSSSSYHSGGPGYGYFLRGEQEFEVERRADGLSVWLRGFPDRAACVPAPQDFNTLRVTPSDWHHEMPVTFSRDVDSCNEHEFRCSDGRCLSLMFKCDGIRDCSDGGDEEACAVNSVEVATGSLVLARVQYKPEHGAIIFLLCGDQSCSHVRRNYCVVDQPGYSGWPGYYLKGCDTTSGLYCYGSAGANACLAEESFPSGSLEFEVELSDETSAEIRLRGETRYSNFADVGSGHNHLMVRPANWVSEMPVNFTVIRDSTTTPNAPLSTQPVTFPPTTQAWATTSTAGSTQATAATTTSSTASSTQATAATTTSSTAGSTQRKPSTTTSPWVTPPTATSPTTTPASSAPTAPTVTPSPAWPPRPAPTVCESRYAYLLLPSDRDCRAYTVCLGGSGRPARCPAPLLFNYTLQTCSWPGTPGAPDAAECGLALQR